MVDHEWKTSNVPGVYYCYNCDSLGFWNKVLKAIEISVGYTNACSQNNPHRIKKVK